MEEKKKKAFEKIEDTPEAIEQERERIRRMYNLPEECNKAVPLLGKSAQHTKQREEVGDLKREKPAKLFSYVGDEKKSDERESTEDPSVSDAKRQNTGREKGRRLFSPIVNKEAIPQQASFVQSELLLSVDNRNFQLQLVKKQRIIRATKEGEKTDLFYVWIVQIGQRSFEATVSAEDVGKFRWVKKATEGMAIYKTEKGAPSFEEFISSILIASFVPEELIFEPGGWEKINGCALYVYADGNVRNFFQNVHGDKRMRLLYTPQTTGTVDVYKKTLSMLQICDDLRITLPIFLFAHAGVLYTPFKESGNPIRFMLALIGESNSRKTSLALCMTKVFNRDNLRSPDVSFNATKGGLEKAVSIYPDVAVVIDGFMPADTRMRQNELDEKLEILTRIYGDGTGIERMTDFTKKPNAGYYPVRNIGIITGEHIHGVKSSLLRHLIVNIGLESVDNERLRVHQEDYTNFSTHMYDFIAWCTANYDDIVRSIAHNIKKYQKKSVSKYPRYCEMYAVLKTVATIFLLYSTERGFLYEQASNLMLQQWDTCLKEVIRANEKQVDRMDWGYVLAEICKTILESGEVEALPAVEAKDYGKRIFTDEIYLYVRLECFLERVHQYLRLWGMVWPNGTGHAILKQLESANLIKTGRGGDGKRTPKLPRSKLNQQCFLHIRIDAIYQKLEMEER